LAANDDKIVELVPTPPGEAGLPWLVERVNRIFRNIYQTLHTLEGRSGTIALRAAATIAGKLGIGSTFSSVTTAPANSLIVEGRVGLQTSDPVTDLHVRTTTSGIYLDSNLASAPFIGRRNNSSYANPTAVLSGDGLAMFGGGGRASTSAYAVGPRAFMVAVATENWTNTANGARLDFYYTPNGSTTVGLVQSFDGTWTMRAVKITGDVTNSTTTLADVTGLGFSVEANKDYAFEFDIIFQTVATTTGIALAMNGPSTPTLINGRTQIFTNVRAVQDEMFIAYDTATATLTANPTANSNMAAKISGIFRNGANAGTLIVRFASEVAASQVTIKAGSCGWIKKI